MNTDRRFRRLVFTASLLAILTYAVADEAWAFGLIAISLALIGWTITERRAGRAIPRALIALSIMLAILWAVTSGLREGLNVAHFCQFTIAVLVIKAYDRRTSADLGQFVMLALFLSIGALLTSNSLWMAIALVPTLLYAVAAAVAYQFHLGRAAARRALPVRGGAGVAIAPERGLGLAPGLAPRGSSGGAPVRGVGRAIALGWAAVVAISLAVFVLFPRNIGADSFGRWGNAGVGMVTGFSSEVKLGEGGFISSSPVTVLDLTVRTPDGMLLGSPLETYYLRGAVLDEYLDGKWTASASARQNLQLLPANLEFLIADRGRGAEGPDRLRSSSITLDVMIRNARAEGFHLFTVWRPRVIKFESSAGIRYGPTDGVITRSGQSGRVRYSVTCEPVESSAAIPLGAVRHETSFPSEPIGRLAADILRAAGLDPDPATRPIEDDAAAASAIERYFDTDFVYTLDIASVPRGMDPIEWFLFERREGHCEYYASAMVALCRSVGINSRVVTGFVATEYNDASHHYIVRESNAHAWVEVEVVPPRATFTTGDGGELVRRDQTQGQWQTRDPTPSGEFQRIHRPEPTIASQVRGLFEAVNYAWITSIVAFDDTTRTSLVSAMRIDTSAIDQWAEDAGRRIRNGGPRLLAQALTNALIASISTVLIGVAIIFGWPALRTALRLAVLPRILALWHRLRRSSPTMRDASLARAGFYARLLAALARRGQPKPEWQPPLQHAGTISPAAIAPAAARVAEAFYRVRFGQRALSAEESSEVRKDLDTIERA